MISLGLDSGSSMTKSRFVRRYEDNRYKDDPNIDQSKEISRISYREKKQHKEIAVIVTTGYEGIC